MLQVFYLLGWFFAGLTFVSLLPLLYALTTSDAASMIVFFEVALIAGFASTILLFGVRSRSGQVSHVEACALIALVFFIGSLISAIPYMLFFPDIPFRLALFEGVSGFTTTGATIFTRVEAMPDSLLLWRALSGWIGGFFFMMAALSILGPTRIGGLPWGQRGMVEMGGENITTRLRDLVLIVFPIYAGLTASCFFLIAVLTSEVRLFYALCLSLGAVSTTGFMPVDADMSFFGSRTLEMILALFMLIASTSIFWQRQFLRHPEIALTSYPEVRWLVSSVCILTLSASIFIYASPFGLSIFGAFREGFFTVVSIVSTTGYSLRSGEASIMTLPLVLIMTLVGGCAFSTAGGLKIYRFAALVIQSSRELQRLLYPHGVRTSQIGRVFYDMQIMKGVWSGFIAFLTLILLSSMVLSADLPDFEAALMMAISLASNAGPLYSSGWGGEAVWPSYFEITALSQWVAILTMLFGRLEVIVLLTLFNLKYWRY